MNDQPSPSKFDLSPALLGNPAVGQTIPHDSAHGHVTGTAPYIDDLPRREDELLVGFVGSPIASGTLESIDSAAAEKIPGVDCLLTVADVGPHNLFGPLFADEPFLADRQLLYVGQPVVIVAAESTAALRQACRLIKIQATESPSVFSIEAAIAGKHFIGPRRQIRRGDPDRALASATPNN